MSKTLAIVFGVVFVLVGVLGFVPNPIVGMNGIFMTNMLHDLVHLVFGIILLAVAFMAPMKSGLWLKILGVVYLVVAVLGFIPNPLVGEMGLVMTNMADHVLHVVLGVVLLVAGFMGGKKAMAPAMPMSTPPPAAPMGGSPM